jgi:hypothetical protein
MQPGHIPAAVPDPGKLKSAKMLRGCGGCGCAFALLLIIGGGVLIGFGAQEATKEAMPFGLIVGGLAVPATIIAAILLIVGIMKVNKLKQG